MAGGDNNNSWAAASYPQGTAALEQGTMDYSEDDFLENKSIDVRHGFIRKVFSLVFLQLCVSFGIVFVFTLNEGVQDYVKANSGMYYSAFAVFFVAIIAVSCCGDLPRKHPYGLCFLALITVALGYMLGVLAAFSEPESVYMAMGITLGITVLLTIFAFQTRIDFTSMYPYLMVALIGLILAGVVFAFIAETQQARFWYGIAGATIFSFLLIFDIQLVIGGKSNRMQYTPDDYIMAALNIYIDVAYIFMYTLTGLNNS